MYDLIWKGQHNAVDDEKNISDYQVSLKDLFNSSDPQYHEPVRYAKFHL